MISPKWCTIQVCNLISMFWSNLRSDTQADTGYLHAYFGWGRRVVNKLLLHKDTVDGTRVAHTHTILHTRGLVKHPVLLLLALLHKQFPAHRPALFSLPWVNLLSAEPFVLFEDEKGHLCCVCRRGKGGREGGRVGRKILKGHKRTRAFLLFLITLETILLTVWRPRKYLGYSNEHWQQWLFCSLYLK